VFFLVDEVLDNVYSVAMILKFDGEHRFLSNFWPAQVVLDGERYASVEAAYQAAKSLDAGFREAVRSCGEDSKAVKALGKKMKWRDINDSMHSTRLRPCWDDEFKLKVMNDLVRQKFSDPELGGRLLATGDQELEEGNWWGDRFWGVCKGEGENHLGKILMAVREELKQVVFAHSINTVMEMAGTR